MTNSFLDYFQCPREFAEFSVKGELPETKGYFRFGAAIGYGRRNGAAETDPAGTLSDARQDVPIKDDRVWLPFDLTEVVTNLREERYQQQPSSAVAKLTSTYGSNTLYYLL